MIQNTPKGGVLVKKVTGMKPKPLPTFAYTKEPMHM